MNFPLSIWILQTIIIGLSFERPYLMEGLNLMIANLPNRKVCGFCADLRSESARTTKSVDFQLKSADFVWFLCLKLENCSLVLSPERGFCETKDHLPKKVTPIFLIALR